MVNMILLLLLLQPLHGIDGAAREPAETACTASACYTVHTENSAFEEARKNCEDNGGTLATVKHRTEAEEIRSVLSRFEGSDTHRDYKFWIGLKLRKGSCIFTDSSLKGFKWISGEQDTEYSSWEKEPEITCTEERCVSVHHTFPPTTSGTPVRWTDRSCKDVAGFICKFNFKGMCKPLLLAGPGKVSYTPPFVTSPLSDGSALTMLPHGTSAEVSCGGNTRYTLCKEMNGFFGWINSGPFCDSSNQGCKYENGGCDHFCTDSDRGGFRCECKDGYELGDDRVTCVQRDHCQDSPCEFKCLPTSAGFACVCPNGLQLAENQINCIDVDECSTLPPVCGNHACHNTQGSYTCRCKNGYSSVNGKCENIDECLVYPCPQGCLDSPGSFSCYCFSGYRTSENGRGCVDIDECLASPCEENCTNTPGSFRCSCRKHFRIASNGVNCIPEPRGESTAHRGEEHRQNTGGHNNPETTTALASTSLYDTLFMNISPDEDTSVVYEGTSKATTVVSKSDAKNEKTDHTNNSVRQVNNFNTTLILACALGSAVALLFVIAVISALVICRAHRQRKDAKKQNSTTDSYCWVSSGNATQTEKLEENK